MSKSSLNKQAREALSQPCLAATMCSAPCSWPYPPSPITPFLLVQKPHTSVHIKVWYEQLFCVVSLVGEIWWVWFVLNMCIVFSYGFLFLICEAIFSLLFSTNSLHWVFGPHTLRISCQNFPKSFASGLEYYLIYAPTFNFDAGITT